MRGSLLCCVLAFSHLSLASLLDDSIFGIAGRNATFDYVVVGGGTAGLTIAHRLAQDGRFSVAVIEAGGFYDQDNGNLSVVPAYTGYPASPLVDWGYTTTPQAGMNNRTMAYTRGKCLGGSSARNSMGYTRPTVGAMQKWAEDVGDETWQWEQVFKYFHNGTTLTIPPPGVRAANATPNADRSVFGKGMLQVSYPSWAAPFASWAIKAAAQLGVPSIDGFSSGRLLGSSYWACTIQPNGERETSQTAFLREGAHPSGLTVYTQTLATRILFQHGTTAAGVSVERDGIAFSLRATREVILSAGAFNTPQLLMLSGIGPRTTLETHGIPLLLDRPGVGQNMWDHVLYALSYPVDVETSGAFSRNATKMAEAVAEYNNHRTGFLTNGGPDWVSLERVTSLSHLDMPEEVLQRLDEAFPADWPQVVIASTNRFAGPKPPDPDQNYASIVIGLMTTFSRGALTLQSSSPHDAPIIDPALFTDPTDAMLAVAAVRRAREYAATEALSSIITGPEAVPGPGVQTDAEILQALRARLSTFYHASATCKMGKLEDSDAVVDSKARVIGTDRLRVVDISAFPFLPPGLPQATVYMLAEKIAAEVLAGS